MGFTGSSSKHHIVLKDAEICLTQNQYDALVDFTFQEGRGHFAKSTLLTKINAHAPEVEIRAEFAKWVYSGGVIKQGLVNRRKADADLYFTPK